MFEKSKINFQVKIDSDNYQISYENGDEYIGGINNERKSHKHGSGSLKSKNIEELINRIKNKKNNLKKNNA